MNPVDRIARMAEVEVWLGDGLNLRIEPPRGEQRWHVALAPDIRIATLGATEEEAIEGMFTLVNRLIDDFVSEGKPLPTRTPGTDEPQGVANDRDEH